jgi:gluconate 2-dehydrogenase gamma chain
MTIPMSRRSLIKAALVLPVLGVVGCGNREPATGQARAAAQFFSEAERRFVEAATERLIPDEQDGRGAGGAHVAVFIDRQLAGPYGQAQRWYMHGPWQEGTEQQGYQLKLTPGELYQTAIKDIDSYCHKTNKKSFIELSAAEQDEVLHGLEAGSIELADVPAKAFFTMLWSNTVEGFLADPMYGGNYNFAGWKLIGFPGPRYNYVGDIEQYGKPYTQPTVGILGRDGTLTMRGV